jgi:hypothetical protein
MDNFMKQPPSLAIPVVSPRQASLPLFDSVWSKLVTTIQLTGLTLFAIGAVTLVQRSNSMIQFIGDKDRTPAVSSMRYVGELGLMGLGLLLMLVASQEGARTWISQFCFGVHQRWQRLSPRIKLGLTLLIVIIAVIWNTAQIMRVPFAFTGDWDLTAAVFRGAKEKQLNEIINGLNEGCILCSTGVQPIENMTTGDDIGLFFFFGIAHKLGLVSASLEGYQRFIALSFAIIIGFSSAVVALSFRSFIAGIILALTITLLDTTKYYESMLITSYWVSGGAAILSASMALGLLGRADLDQKVKNRPSYWFYYVIFGLWGLIAGWAYLGRSSAGPITLISALVVLAVLAIKLRRVIRWLPALGLLAFGFIVVVASFQFTLQWRITHYNLPQPTPHTMANHPFSHAILVGMGYVTNDEGLIWNDNIGKTLAEQECPSVVYLGPDYYTCVRDIVIKVIVNDPNLLIRSLLAKFEATIQVTFGFFVYALLAIVALYTLRSPSVYLVFGVILILNVAPGILTVPYPSYLQGYFQSIMVFIAAGVIIPGLRLAAHLESETLSSLDRVDDSKT